MMSRLLWIGLLAGGTALAQAPAQTVDAKLAALESAAKAAQSAGDNAWMLVCAALVLLMTGPGLALFYGGLGRKKKVLATLMQSFTKVGGGTVLLGAYWFNLPVAARQEVLRGLRLCPLCRRS